jgi:ribosomal protein S18 acetylase RimI-like enzyme
MGITFNGSSRENEGNNEEIQSGKADRGEELRNILSYRNESIEIEKLTSLEENLKDLTRLYLNGYKGLEIYAYKTAVEIKEYLHWLYKRDKDGILVAKDKGKIVGFIATDKNWMWTGEKFGEIHELVVHPDYRGRGLGKLLLERAIKRLKSENLRKIGLWVGEKNEKARKIYEKLGFTETEKRGKWIRMVKIL